MRNDTVKIGMEIEPSAEHREQFPNERKPRTVGVVLSQGRYKNCWNIKWRGFTDAESLHCDLFDALKTAERSE